MPNEAPSQMLITTALTVLVGILGAWVGWALSAPVFMLMGPAVAVCLASLAGMQTGVDDRLRDVCFVVLGLAVGAGFDADALGAMVRWPLALVIMGCAMWLILLICRAPAGAVLRLWPSGGLVGCGTGAPELCRGGGG